MKDAAPRRASGAALLHLPVRFTLVLGCACGDKVEGFGPTERIAGIMAEKARQRHARDKGH
jgi:hypothetical protein